MSKLSIASLILGIHLVLLASFDHLASRRVELPSTPAEFYAVAATIVQSPKWDKVSAPEVEMESVPVDVNGPRLVQFDDSEDDPLSGVIGPASAPRLARFQSADVGDLETSRTEASGSARARTITTTWNSTFRLPASIAEPKRTTSFTFDSAGNVLTRTVTDTSVTPNGTRVWTYTYDSYGRVLTENGPRADVSDMKTYTYYTCTTGSECGQLHTVTDAAGNVTTYSMYDADGQLLAISDPMASSRRSYTTRAKDSPRVPRRQRRPPSPIGRRDC